MEMFYSFNYWASSTFFCHLGKNTEIYYDKSFEVFNMEEELENTFERDENKIANYEDIMSELRIKKLKDKDENMQKYYEMKCKEIIVKYCNILFNLKKQNIEKEKIDNSLFEAFCDFQEEVGALKKKCEQNKLEALMKINSMTIF